MAHDVRFSPQSRRDLGSVWRYIATDDRKTADRIVRGIEARCASLAQRPQLGRSRPELSPDIRCLLFERWLVFYRIRGERIDILRVIDGARDLGNIDWPAD